MSTSVLLGPSGAGKSTLVNALLGFERQAIGAVSEHNGGRGRHTTVTRDLLALPSGALLIDTPGIREAGLWDGGGVDESFADIEELVNEPEDTTRYLVTRLALAAQAALLVKHAPTAVADAFVTSRLGTGWGPGYGTLRGVDFEAIIDHARLG